MNMEMSSFQKGQREAGFTMIEIAICIAVVAFALVAIIGILPTGMTVQRDNREDTVLNQEGAYWLEAIRGGARGVPDLGNYVEAIIITNTIVGRLEIPNNPNAPMTSEQIIGLLTTPKLTFVGGTTITNRVTARVKALTGAASEKGSLTNEQSFRYELQAEVIPFVPPPSYTTNDVPTLRNENLFYNLHDVRIVLRWPLFERGDEWATGNGRKYFRGTVAGGLTTDTNLVLPVPGLMAYFLRQNTFTNVTPVL